MRTFVILLAVVLLILPTLLILFGRGKALRVRIGWAMVAFLSPVVMIGLVQMLPRLTNNSPNAAQWERFVGLLLSGAGFILPWILFAMFLHHGSDRRR